MLLSSLKGDLILAYRVTPSWAWSAPDTNKASPALNFSHQFGCRLLLSLRELLHKMTYNSSYAIRYLYHQTHRPTANKLPHASYSPAKKGSIYQYKRLTFFLSFLPRKKQSPPFFEKKNQTFPTSFPLQSQYLSLNKIKSYVRAIISN